MTNPFFLTVAKAFFVDKSCIIFFIDIDNDSCSSDGLIKSLQGFKLHNFSNVPEQQSCTSIPQQWHVPRGSKIKPVPINHLVVARPTESRKRKPVTCQIDLDQELPKVSTTDIMQLKMLKGTPLEYTISAGHPLVNTPLGDVQIGSILSYQVQKLLHKHMY